MAELSQDQLRQLCEALGWQGGTFWQVLEAVKQRSWQPMKTAPKDGREFLAWFPKVKLDDDDNPTTEVIGGAQAIINYTGGSWNEPEWLNAHGPFYLEDWCFADEPVLWQPLPPGPIGPVASPPGVDGRCGGTGRPKESA